MTRSELIDGIKRAAASVERTIPRLTQADLGAKYPELIAKRAVSPDPGAVRAVPR